LSHQLRKHPESEKLVFLVDFVDINPLVALDLARKCLSHRKSFETLLEKALSEADRSVMKYWLECIVPRLGFRRVVQSLQARIRSNAEGVARAVYWLPKFSGEQGYSRDMVEYLEAKIRS